MSVDITELTSLHDALARRLKEYEQATGEFPPVEVLNETRYALRAALELLAVKEGSIPEGGSSEAELSARILHALKCGYHDLVDGLVILIPGIIDGLRQSFPESVYDAIGEELIRIQKDVRQAQALIAESRGKPAARQSIYDQKLYDEWFAKLLEHIRFLKEAGPVIAQRENAKDRAIRRERLINVAVGVVTMMIGVALGYFIR